MIDRTRLPDKPIALPPIPSPHRSLIGPVRGASFVDESESSHAHGNRTPASLFFFRGFSRQEPIDHPCLSRLPVRLPPSQAAAHGESRRGSRNEQPAMPPSTLSRRIALPPPLWPFSSRPSPRPLVRLSRAGPPLSYCNMNSFNYSTISAKKKHRQNNTPGPSLSAATLSQLAPRHHPDGRETNRPPSPTTAAAPPF